MTWDVREGDCVSLMAAMPAGSVDSVVCDPPYGLNFMGKHWDNPAMLGTDNAKPGGGSNYFKRKGDDGYVSGNAAWYGHTEPRREQQWHQAWATEALRVLKPGGHLLAFGGTRTYHRLVCAVEDAGFEIRDTIAYMYGSGFPKSLNVGKAIDRASDCPECEGAGWRVSGSDADAVEISALTDGVAGATFARLVCTRCNGTGKATREVVGRRTDGRYAYGFDGTANRPTGAPAGTDDAERIGGFVADKAEVTAPATPEAERWEGWGTALKPAHEPVVVARKPLSGTVAATVLEWGTGSINVNGCRIGTGSDSERGEGVGGEADPRGCPVHGVRGLRQTDEALAVSGEAGEAPDDLRANVHGSGEARSGQPSLDGRHMGGQAVRLPAREDGLSERGGPGATAPADAARGSGASVSDGPVAGSPLAVKGARPPHQRGQAGQSAGEPDADGLGGAHARAPSGAAEADAAGGGEPGAAGCTCGNTSLGRWPANVVLDEQAAGLLDEQTGELTSGRLDRAGITAENLTYGAAPKVREGVYEQDSGGASRFFYVAKASRGERNAGLEGFEERPVGSMNAAHDGSLPRNRPNFPKANGHPTVKPISLMRWLVRLVTPPGGICLDPFAGSGSTGAACMLEGFDFLGLEREPEYVAIANARIGWWHKHRGDGEAAEILAAGEVRESVEATGQLDMFGEEAV